jgi:PAS domain S-box-containing protein
VAFSVAVIAGLECAIMRATTPAQFLVLHRWAHVFFFFTTICIVGFVQTYFRTGRPWLLWTFVAARALVLVLAFVPGPTFNFREVTAMVPFEFFGETLMSPRGVPTPWEHLGNLSGLLLVWFVVDAAIRLWRKGNDREQQRAVVVAAGVVMFVLSCFTNGILIHHIGAQVPYFITLSFLFIVAAMGFELSRDLMHAARMAAELRENAESMSLAASAAQLAFWRWDIPHDAIWVSPDGRGLYGTAPGETINLHRFLDTLHPDDREPVRLNVQRALNGDGSFRAEYRVVLPDGTVRWIGARGKAEFNEARQPLRMRGVSIDITERKSAELEAARHREELTHLMRVVTLSELSGSLAHELNQPLMAILASAQAAQRYLARVLNVPPAVREVLTAIIEQAKRAGEVIKRLRALMKKTEVRLQPLALNELICETLQLMHSELVARNVTVIADPATDTPAVNGDRVQLQQLLINLIVNACDAMQDLPPSGRKLRIATAPCDRGVRLSVSDSGPGVPSDKLAGIFEPFYTTKQHGLGLGLSICASIAKAHNANLRTENAPEGGAVFMLDLGVAAGDPT